VGSDKVPQVIESYCNMLRTAPTLPNSKGIDNYAKVIPIIIEVSLK
jgi:hypothetical protein